MTFIFNDGDSNQTGTLTEVYVAATEGNAYRLDLEEGGDVGYIFFHTAISTMLYSDNGAFDSEVVYLNLAQIG